ETAARHFGITPRRVQQGNWWHTYLPAPYRLTHGKRNPIVGWLARFGLDGKRSYEKFVPAPVFAFDDARLAVFLKHLWATDGCVLGKSGQLVRIYYSSSSRRLADDVQALLLRFGIVGRIKTTRKGDYRPNYMVHIYGRDHQMRFLNRIGVHGQRSIQA